MMTKPVLTGLLWAMLALSSAAQADMRKTLPDNETIKAQTAQCRLSDHKPAKGIIGISDPHTLNRNVADLIAETGVQWVRAELHWSRVEPALNRGYRWSMYDTMIKRFQDRGIKVQLILTYPPEFTQKDWSVLQKRYEIFVNRAVQRYAPRGVHYWEVFNEPNLPGYGWLTKDVSAKEHLGGYTMLLALTNKAVRKHDPDGFVILGGLASDQHRGLPAESTMKTIYGLGAKRCFDIFAYHPYGYQNQFPQARARVDRILKRAGDQGKPVWFNEYGWTDHKSMDRARNATVQTNPMMAAFAQRHAADALFWFSARDYSRKLGTPTFGLATHKGKKRPSFETFRELVAQSK